MFVALPRRGFEVPKRCRNRRCLAVPESLGTLDHRGDVVGDMAKRPLRAVFTSENPINMRSESQAERISPAMGTWFPGVYDTMVGPHPGMMSPSRVLGRKRCITTRIF